MQLKILQLLIQSACSDGSISDTEKQHIETYAAEIGINKKHVAFLIQNELRRVAENKKAASRSKHISTKDSQIAEPGFSGFISNSNQNTESGFLITENDSGFITPLHYESNHYTGQSGFSDIQKLRTSGKMSDIYKAKYHGKWVIIKRLKKEFQEKTSYRKLFYKEFENTFHLEHPNIVRIYGKEKDKRGEFYFMEYIDGQTLTKLIGKQGIENGELIKKIALEILSALQYIHKRQIYHRDLKPDNIIITYKGDNVKIIDFGLAVADSFDENLIQAGTPKYAAPEQKTSRDSNQPIIDQVDGRSDIYSFGLILSEMLTGTIENTESIKKRSMSTYIIVKRCTENTKDKRYNNCREVMEGLQNIRILNLQYPLIDQPKKPEHQQNTDNGFPVVDLHHFFSFTHKKWRSGHLQGLKNYYSLEPDFKTLAENNSAYQLMINVLQYDLFSKAFVDRYLIAGEYFIHHDKHWMLLTNFRLFLRHAPDAPFTIFDLEEVLQNRKEAQITNRIYVTYKGYTFWKSDWELTCRAAKQHEWNTIPKKLKPLIVCNHKQAFDLMKKLQMPYVLTDYSINNHLNIPHVSVGQFIRFSKQIYQSNKIIAWYNNRYRNHSPQINKWKQIIEQIFAEYYPLKGEFIILDSLHLFGMITNYRIFYKKDENSAFEAVRIDSVRDYSLVSGSSFSSKKVEIILTGDTKISLPVDSNALHAVTEKTTRIKTALSDCKRAKTDNKILSLALLKKAECDRLWEVENINR